MSGEPQEGRMMDVAQGLAPESITLRIAAVRGQRVILDSDLAALYEVPTKRFNEAVKRNLGRFPADFMFALTQPEWDALRSQFATLETGRGQHRKYLPYAFTEHGAIMAATVLSSPRAIEVSVYVVRAFVRLRELVSSHRELSKRLDDLEQKTEALAMSHETFSRNTRAQLRQVFDALRQLTRPAARTEPCQEAHRVHHPRGQGQEGDGCP